MENINIVAYRYDDYRVILTDGKKWVMCYNPEFFGKNEYEKIKDIPQFLPNEFEKKYQNMKKYSKKPWAPDECRDCGDRVEKEGNQFHFWRHSPEKYRYIYRA